MKKPINILIAEDEHISYKLLEIIISQILSNYKLLHAFNGQEAVEIFQNNSIDIVLMDIKMPKMNGMEATKLIKNKNPNIPIIAQTAFTQNHELELISQSGVNDVLAKPINKGELSTVFQKYLTDS